MESNDLAFIDLFAGIGGFRLAFEDKDCKCVFSSEWDKFSQVTYNANFNEIPNGDITKIESSDIPNHDILLGGFPCQPFSTIGKREGFEHDTQGTLFFEIVRILNDKKPKSFVLENVAGLTSHDNGNTFNTIINSLDELGYTVSYKILDSADYGVPQHRRRIYIVGFRKELGIEFTWPVENKENVYIGNFVESNKEGYSISKHLQDNYLYKKDDGKPQIIDSSSMVQVKTLVSTYHKIQRLTGTFVRDGETGIRLLSENECKAIMGFPMDFIIPVSRTQMYRQFGNSVAVPVVKAIAEEVKRLLRG